MVNNATLIRRLFSFLGLGVFILIAIACSTVAVPVSDAPAPERSTVRAATPIPSSTSASAAGNQTAQGAVIPSSPPTPLPTSTSVSALDGGNSPISPAVAPTPVPTPTQTVTAVPTQAPPQPAPKSLTGTAVIVVPHVGAEIGSNGDGSPDFIRHWGIGETLFLRDADNSAAPWIASGWELEPDLSGATIYVRDDIPFQSNHFDFGNVTAADVAWSMNVANATTNPDSMHPHSGNFAAAWKDWEVTGTHEIKFDFVQFDITWLDDILNQSGNSFTTFSKVAFDVRGEDWASEHVVATGPFEIESWYEEDSLTLVNRYFDGGQHYLPELTPKTHRIQFIQITSPSTRFALLKSGEADATLLEPLAGAEAKSRGFDSTSTEYVVQLGVFFPGNLWEETHAVTGEQLQTGGAYVHDLAWIGEPDGPPGAPPSKDMEEARKVRRALAVAIDRESINQKLLGGLGTTVHVTNFSTSDPNWDPKWEYPNDRQEAIDILSNQITADYIKGDGVGKASLGGNAFAIQLWVGPELGGSEFSITGDIADAIASQWTQLGLKVTVAKNAVDPVRSFLPGRMFTHPWLTSCELGRESIPWNQPKGLLQTSLTRGGFGCVIESPEIVDFYRRMATAEDQQAGAQAATEYLDYVYHWNLQPGVVAIPFELFYNPEKISSWPMPESATSAIDGVWNLELK